MKYTFFKKQNETNNFLLKGLENWRSSHKWIFKDMGNLKKWKIKAPFKQKKGSRTSENEKEFKTKRVYSSSSV
jgi:hypothetical protein